jgi:hypothetical protein
MKFTRFVILAITTMLLVSTLSSAFVFRNVTKERQEELERYEAYKEGYIEAHDLEGYEDYIAEYNLKRNFGFYHPSRYTPDRGTYNAKYNAPLQGEIYSGKSRILHNSLDQPSAVKFYSEIENGRRVGFVKGDLNGVYFDHPDAKVTYGYIGTSGSRYNSYPGAVRYESYAGYGGEYYDSYPESIEDARYYARVASQVSDDWYVVGYR